MNPKVIKGDKLTPVGFLVIAAVAIAASYAVATAANYGLPMAGAVKNGKVRK